MTIGNDSDRDWERFGRDDPYFGVYAARRFRRRELTPAALAEFFASGETHVGEVFAAIERHVKSGFRPRRALDFGCGVGRVLVALAKRASDVVGFDVSASMLAEAEKNLAERGIGNVTLVRGDDSLESLAGTFDLVHSFVVFQHFLPERGERLVRELVSRLESGGIGVLHFTYTSDEPLRSRLVAWGRRRLPLFHGLWNWRHGKRFDAPWMQMNRYDLNRLFALLQELGAHRCHVRFTDHGGHRGLVLFFEKVAEASFPGPTRSAR